MQQRHRRSQRMPVDQLECQQLVFPTTPYIQSNIEGLFMKVIFLLFFNKLKLRLYERERI